MSVYMSIFIYQPVFSGQEPDFIIKHRLTFVQATRNVILMEQFMENDYLPTAIKLINTAYTSLLSLN